MLGTPGTRGVPFPLLSKEYSMAKQNPCDILTSDWNPVVGCQRYSAGCRDCWWLDGIMPWQIRLGNLPETVTEGEPTELEARFDPVKLRPKKGIVGVVQHGDLFWDKISDATIHRVLDVVDKVAQEREKKNIFLTKHAKATDINEFFDMDDKVNQKHEKKSISLAQLGQATDNTKYILWSKRAERMANFMEARYPEGVPSYLACGVSIENQSLADERLPHLLRVKGHRFVMIEPMLGPIDLTGYEAVDWVVLGSETGADRARRLDLKWARQVRDFAVANNLPFFIKQVGSSHKSPVRKLDGRTWDEFPPGFIK
jgi:protein gp37